MNNQVKLLDGIRVKMNGQNEPVDVVQIDFSNKTFTWMFRGHLENTESFDDVEYWELPDTPPVPTIKPGDKVRHDEHGEGGVRSTEGADVWVFFDKYDYDLLVPKRSLEVVE